MDRKGPFGLWMGMGKEDLAGPLEELAAYKFATTNVPHPHSAFESYVLQITPQLGLSWIKGIGLTIPTNSFGSAIRSSFDSLEERLTAVYGRGERTDLLLDGTIWNEPQDFMQGMQNQERYLLTRWERSVGSTMKDNLHQVGLMASAIDAWQGYLTVEYSFENAEAADVFVVADEDVAL